MVLPLWDFILRTRGAAQEGLQVLVSHKRLIGLGQQMLGEWPEHLWAQNRSLEERALVVDGQGVGIDGLNR